MEQQQEPPILPLSDPSELGAEEWPTQYRVSDRNPLRMSRPELETEARQLEGYVDLAEAWRNFVKGPVASRLEMLRLADILLRTGSAVVEDTVELPIVDPGTHAAVPPDMQSPEEIGARWGSWQRGAKAARAQYPDEERTTPPESEGNIVTDSELVGARIASLLAEAEHYEAMSRRADLDDWQRGQYSAFAIRQRREAAAVQRTGRYIDEAEITDEAIGRILGKLRKL